VAQRGDSGIAFKAGINQLFAQGADDAIATGVHFTQPGALAGGLDNATGGGIDNGGNATGLGVEHVLG